MSELAPRLYILEGTCSTGKSSLFDRYVQESPSDIVLVPESAREFWRLHDIPDSERYSLDTQSRIQDATIEAIAAACGRAHAEGKSAVLADTSPLAAVAYASLSDPEMASKLFNRLDGWFAQVTMFFLLSPHEVPYSFNEDDDIRRETHDQRMKVHYALGKAIVESGVLCLDVIGPIEVRMKIVNRAMQAYDILQQSASGLS